MINYFKLNCLPDVYQIYKITRKTVWQITDPYNILVVVIKGSCVFMIDNDAYVVNSGESFFIPHDVNYLRKPYNDEACTFYYIHFSLNTQIQSCGHREARDILADVRSELSNDTDKYYFENKNNTLLINNHVCYSNFSEIRELLQTTFDEHIKNHFESHISASLYLCEILTCASHETRKQIADKNDSDLTGAINFKLRKSLDYIRLNYANNIMLDDLCKYSNVSPQHLIRCFKKELKKTPIQYINEYRINRAKEYFLNFPALTVKEVANELGFEDQHYFSRLFAKINKGETPTQFRERVVNYPPVEE